MSSEALKDADLQLPGVEITFDVGVARERPSPTDLFAAFNQFELEIATLQTDISDGTVNPGAKLGSGVRSDAYILPSGKVVKLPRTGGSLSVPEIVDDYVDNLLPGTGLHRVEQIVAASREVGAVVSEPITGTRLKALRHTELVTIDDSRLDALCTLFEGMAARGLGQENPIDDTVYDAGATSPNDAFGIIDFQAGVNEPVPVFIGRFATAIVRPIGTLTTARTAEDYAEVAREQSMRLDILHRLQGISETRYPDSFEITDRLNALIGEGQRFLGKYRDSDWVMQRTTSRY